MLRGLLSSLRGRLVAVMILGLGATAFAVVALTHLARTSREQRTLHARDRVEAELERLAEIEPAMPRAQRAKRGRRGLGELRSGYVDSAASLDNPRLTEVVRDAREVGTPVIVQSSTADGNPVIAGAVKLEDGGVAWALFRVVVGPEMSSLRVAVVCLAIGMLVIIFASVQTLIVFDRGASALRESVVLLAQDLHATLRRPKLSELAEVADGLDSLARQLSRTQEDKVRLMQELSEHERWASLGRVVAGVAHEVRNPLAAIKLRTDLAEGTPGLGAALREDLMLIGSEVTRLDRLVRDLLLLADRKQHAQSRVPTDLAALATRRVELLRPWADGRGVSLETLGAGEAPIDVDAVTRALDNLLRNAIEASPRGSTVRVETSDSSARAAGATAGIAKLAVVDAGAGVPLESAPMIFEPFFTTKPTGTGLGLALSRAVAESHGGSLEHSREGGLTRFTLALAKA